MPDVPLRESAVALKEDGELVFIGMSRDAFRLSFGCASAWRRFRMARRIGEFRAMLDAETRARHLGGRLAVLLREEGFPEEEIAALLRRRQHDDDGTDPDR